MDSSIDAHRVQVRAIKGLSTGHGHIRDKQMEAGSTSSSLRQGPSRSIAQVARNGRYGKPVITVFLQGAISVTHTLHLNYYHMQLQYKFVIQFVQQYKNLYAKFEAYLRRNEGLIRNSLLFKSEAMRLCCLVLFLVVFLRALYYWSDLQTTSLRVL